MDDILVKCKGGFRLQDCSKAKSYFTHKREENAVNDLFAKIFEIDMKKRITIAALKDHLIFKLKNAEEEST